MENCPAVIQSGDSDNNTLRPALVGHSEESSPVNTHLAFRSFFKYRRNKARMSMKTNYCPSKHGN